VSEDLPEPTARAKVVRRRQLALAAVACTAAVAGALVGSLADDEQQPPRDAASAPVVCPPAVAADPRRLTGQMLVVRMEGSATGDLRRRARRGEIGGVVLFPPLDTATSALRAQVEALRKAAAAGGAPAPLVTIDQEGGEVKRLPAAPPARTPPELGTAGPTAARAEGRATGRALARLGINVDLAPVLDMPVSDAFIGSRAFAADPETVSAVGIAFGQGLQHAGVAATAKHFPGLGRAVTNTDLAPSAVGATRAELRTDLAPFRAAAAAGLELVMVSNAVYPAFDRASPASLSPTLIQALLRDRLGYRGVVISDDLGAGALTGMGIGEGAAAVRAARAGVDLLLFALSDGSEAHRSLRRALRSGRLGRRTLLASCARTTELRARLAR